MNRSQAPILLLLSILAGLWVGVVWRQPPGTGPARATEPAAGRPGSSASAPEPEAATRTSGTMPLLRAAPRSATTTRVADPAGPLADPPAPEEVRALKLKALEEILADSGSFADLPEQERSRLALYAGQLALSNTPFTRCWTPGTPRELVQAYLRVEQRITTAGGFNAMALRVADRWGRTATNGTNQGIQGQPVTLTWSIVPDGTPIAPSDTAESSDPSNLRARMAAIYGGSATGDPTAQPWFPIYQAVFDNLGAISGLRFVYEPNDDGLTIDSITGSSDWGSLGLRGDIRLSGHPIDGNNGVLAYAYYPDNGDVVIDTNDTYYNTISNDSIRLRNILEHEIGHSLGLAHVCPIDQTKLMEPFVNTNFRGSQFDDVYSHQRNYGDPLEVHGSLRNNDSPPAATPLVLSPGSSAAWQWLSIDDSTDLDHYAFSGTTTQQVTVRIIPSDPILPADPNLDTYLEGPQNSDGSCSAGTDFDPTTQQDLILDLLAANGSTVLASAPIQAAGLSEEITSFQLPASGTHYIRVRGGAADRAQLYRMEVLLVDAAPAPQVLLTASRLDAESNSGANGAPDPDETVRYGITLTNQGNLTASNLSATLSAPNGSTLFTSVADFGSLAPGASAERLFTFALAGTAGQVRNLQLAVTGNGYSTTLPFALTLGTTGSLAVLAANFDAASNLPAGWSGTVSAGGSPWVISTTQSNSPPRSAFSAGVAVAGESTLQSPSLVVGANGGTLEFRHRYDLESRLDGGVLEVSRNGGAWADILTDGLAFESGGYVDFIRQSAGTSLSRRRAWTGTSGSFVNCRVALPAAWAGQSITFRWRLVHDSSTAGAGWFIDDVNFSTTTTIADPFRPFVSLAASAPSITEGGSAASLTLSTPLPLVRSIALSPALSGSAGATDLAAPLSFLLPAGSTSVQVELSATADGLAEGPETLGIAIPTGGPDYAPATPSEVTIAIQDSEPLPATVTLSDLSPTYDGTPQAATVTTDPAGLSYDITYGASNQPPTLPGSYAVTATITDPGYRGSASGILTIRSPYSAWIAGFADPADPAAAASGDLDQDGWDNAAEYAFGTLPDDPASRPRLQPLLTATALRLMVPTPPPGIQLSGETSLDLDHWTGEGVTAIPGGFEVPRDATQRFLRIVYTVNP